MGQGLLGVVTLYGALRSAETSVCPLSYSSPFPPATTTPPRAGALGYWQAAVGVAFDERWFFLFFVFFDWSLHLS